MKLGVLKETFPGEARVALTPASALQQQKLGHECFVEAGAGAAAQFSDADYEKAGVTVCATAADLIGAVDVVAKVRPPTEEEVDQLVEEIQTVAESANFNGKNLLDGSFQNSVFQTGANVGDTVSVSISKVDTDALGSAATAGISSSVTRTPFLDNAAATADLSLVAGDIVINGVSVGASDGSVDTASSVKSASSAIAKAAAINEVSDQTGVTATASPNTVRGTNVAAGALVQADFELNGVDFNIELGATTTTSDVKTALDGVATEINAQSGLTGITAAVVEDGTTYRIDLTAEDGRNIDILDIDAGDAAAIGLAAGAATNANVYTGNVTLVSRDGSDIELSSTSGNIDNIGFEEGTYSGTSAGVVGDNSIDAARDALVAGDLTINGTAIGVTLDADDNSSSTLNADSAIALAAAINRQSDATGVTATANQNTVYSTAVTAGASALTINGVALTIASTAGGTVADTVTAIVDGVNAASGQTGVRAEALDGDQYRLIAEDGRNIQTTGAAGNVGITDDVRIAGVTLEAAGQFTIGTDTGNIARSGLTVGTFGGSESGSKLSDIDITTAKGAEDAIIAIDNAVNTVASRRAELGAIQNRFESTIANLEISRENLSAANSRIQDADFAAETAALSKSQVLQQAGISVLAQANARPQQVLSLLQ